jgi:SAM-dependent methyltransferase
MHVTAKLNGKFFFDTYVKDFVGPTIVEIGSQDVNGSLREVAPKGANYLGLDFVEGRGVDVILSDPYNLTLEDEFADIVVTSSCFEHSEMFWIVFLEALRILKPNGILYVNAPSNGQIHRYPVDCWRFYPDAGQALASWGRRSGYKTILLESYISRQKQDMWNDFVAIFLKDEQFLAEHPNRIIHQYEEFENGWVYGAEEFLKPSNFTEDMQKLKSFEMKISSLEKELELIQIERAKLPLDFNSNYYLDLNPDVQIAGVDPIQHYLEYGFYESRKYKE